MITAAGSEPGPGGVGPGAVIRTGCADRGGGAQGQHRMGLGDGGPDARRGLAAAHGELLEKGLAYNLCHLARMRRAKAAAAKCDDEGPRAEAA